MNLGIETTTQGEEKDTKGALILGDQKNPATPAIFSHFTNEFYASLLSESSNSLPPSAIRSLMHHRDRPGLISFLAGDPAPSTFPITSLSFTLRSPTDPSTETPITIKGEDLETSLKYTASRGINSLIDWLYGIQEHSHGRKRGEGWRISIGAGCQDLIYKAFSTLLNPGDSVLIEAPVYTGVIPILQWTKADSIEVETDGNGISASHLKSILDKWPAEKPLPKLLFTVPYGCNPTGATASLQRRLEVLALARKYNFLILEDDPYFYLYYGPEPRPASYFHLEAADGRGVGLVLRLDSLSKVLSSGLRIGFASGPEALLDALDKHTSSSNLQPASVSQVIAHSVLSHWGIDGLLTHTATISLFYKSKRDMIEVAMKKHLSGLAVWNSPVSGMFIWMKLLLPPAPSSIDGDGDSNHLIQTKALERGVLALPGSAFFPNGRMTAYVRVAFSVLTEEQADVGMRRLAEVVREERDAAGVATP
ncbi:hypothetical protein BOTBODRAFT_33591 [Botryobasidium botryosum FD-172 SS1]|uniref:Aminotransferase class I/classII large domain-containing protein n=1 Tax=Botryobasidium botryosum (strain FD-172 SS1) TaxID=930990 RepID=A0A067MDE2_BOTB1|nr:hypothetical protein BOTBODRAFT_33591 [Botryobasidium botryosum FD-172 SS1]